MKNLNDKMKIVGDKVKEFRISENLSRREFANKMNVSCSLQTQIELGFKPASKRYIEKFHIIFPNADLQLIFFDYNILKMRL